MSMTGDYTVKIQECKVKAAGDETVGHIPTSST